MENDILNGLIKPVFENAKRLGFHDKKYSGEHWLAMIITECSELVEADRKSNKANLSEFFRVAAECKNDEDFKKNFDENIKNSIEDEMADIVIRILDTAGLYNRKIDINEAGKIYPYSSSTYTEFLFLMSRAATDPYFNNESVLNELIYLVLKKAEDENIDIYYFIKLKIKYNKFRQRMHGKRY